MHEHSLDPFATNRRVFFNNSCRGIGTAALAGLLNSEAEAQAAESGTHFAPRAKRIIYLFQSGGPAHQDLFDHKPLLQKMNGQ